MEFLSKDQILSASDLPTREVKVPEWGGCVKVKTLTAGERDAWEQSIYTGDGKPVENFRARLVVATVIDASGARVFSDADAPALSAKSSVAVDRIFDEAQRLNGIGKKDAEQLEKNL